MKKVDKLILQAFLGPFSLTFIVVVFIFLTQYLLKYLDDFVGKGLDAAVYAELIFYFSINMIPVSLPLSVLLACLMTYGNLGEHFELTALKSSGISLTRALLPVGIIAFTLTIGSFYFSDVIVPKANLRAYSLLYDIRQKKPALDFKEGAFYNGLPGYSVKISKKHDDGRTIEGVMIYNHNQNKGNVEVILADSGQMYTFNNERFLALELFKGQSYTEYIQDGNTIAPKEFVRNGFKKTKLIFNLASFGLNRTPVELFSTNRLMKPIKDLEIDLDSMKKENQTTRNNMYGNIASLYPYPVAASDTIQKSTIQNAEKIIKKDEPNVVIYNRAANNARSVKSYLAGTRDRVEFITREIRFTESEKVKRYTQACAVFIMFLIGAPLGAIIKKGGFGAPVIISICFFIFYYVTTMIGEKWSKEAVTDMYLGMWIGNITLLPIGLFLLRQARRDSRILEADFYMVLYGKIKKLFSKK